MSIAEEATQPESVQLYRYWQGLCRGRAMPCRQDLDPLDIPGLLPNLLLIDVEPEPLRFRYRLVGTRIVAYRRELQIPDHTGRYADEIEHHFGADLVVQQFTECVRTQEPVLRTGQVTSSSGSAMEWERLVLPLSEDGRRVTMLIVAFKRFEADKAAPPKGIADDRA